MAQSNIMAWNLGGLNQQRAAASGFPFVQLIASVIKEANISLIGFSGIFSGLAQPLGELLYKELNNLDGSNTKWNYQGSPPLGAGRDEQYMFIWDMTVFGAYAPNGTDYWQWDYPRTDGQSGNYGFPRPYDASPDMPPFTMYFKLGRSQNFMPFAIFHAPEWDLGQTPGQGIFMACANISQIAAFDQGQGSLIMGTFNVPHNDDVTVNGSNGAGAFETLAGANGKYTQAMSNQMNLLADNAIVAMGMENALVQTADNFFFRRNATNGITFTNSMVVNIFLASMNSLDASGKLVKAPLAPALARIEAVAVGMNRITASENGGYGKLEDAFAVYRTYVSSYLPIMGTLNY